MDKPDAHLIDFNYDPKQYDPSNPLVVLGRTPKHKGERNLKRKESVQCKILSKKKRKELERKLAQKEKKLTRLELWQELASLSSKLTSEPKISVLPIFHRTRKQPKLRTSSSQHPVKGKAWKNVSPEHSDVSKSTDEYSTDEDDLRSSEAPIGQQQQSVTTEGPADLPGPVNVCETLAPDVSKPLASNPARFVLVSRTPETIAARLTLPIISEEATIIEAITENDCIILCGATGCGKTTQVPQFLYEAGYTANGFMIGVTEPRRVAAISMSKRVGEELNLPSSRVSYHIRYENNVTQETEIKFMTDGVLLQEIKQDFELSRYSVIIIDEAHERSIYTDVLLGLISMIIRLRRKRYTEGQQIRGSVLPPLKLIIMSATLRVTDFSENHRLFPRASSGPPPVIHVESRQFPVTCHFAKVTHDNYLRAAFRKVVQLHQSNPPGGILVFLTGQQEVLTLCSWLSKAFPYVKRDGDPNPHEQRRRRKKSDRGDANDFCAAHDSAEKTRIAEPLMPTSPADLPTSHINLDNFEIIPLDEEVELGNPHEQQTRKNQTSVKQSLSQSDDEMDELDDDEEALEEVPIHAVPLYSLLPPERQQLVFEPPPEGHRLVVVSTNIAETSLTIPNIRYVVDTGKVKTKVYDAATGASTFQIVWISQASAEQRSGRAGRVAPGHCYRLYSSQVFSSMDRFTVPELLTKPIDEVVLMLKSYLGSTPLSRFPLPTPPSFPAIEYAERRLVALGALEELSGDASGDTFRTITRAGRWMSHLPLPTRFARMLLFANQQQLMPYAVILVAALSVPNLFLPRGTTESDPSTGAELFAGRDLGTSAVGDYHSKFVQQFVGKRGDLYLGDLAVLLGTVCCLERYNAQLLGLTPPEPRVLEACGGAKQVSRDPDGALRFLVKRCGVRWNAYKEIRQLRRQLTDILNSNIPDLGLSLDLVLPRPTTLQFSQLRQLFLVGSPCHVASKFGAPVEGVPAKDRRRLRFAYKVPGVRDPVFIDPTSPLARENCPFVAFLELSRITKPFLRTVCAIDPSWIPFLTPQNYRVESVVLTDEAKSVQKSPDVHKPESSADRNSDTDDAPMSCSTKPGSSSQITPSPHYDSHQDIVVTGAKRVFYTSMCSSAPDDDKGELELPAFSVVFPIHSRAVARVIGSEEALMWSVRWFARSLIDGLVFTEFSSWFPKRMKRTLSSSLLTVSWGIVRNEVRRLVSTLLAHKIDNRRLLSTQWKLDPLYLSKELAIWIQSEHVDNFNSNWPLVKDIGCC
ncbi:unnamed protein product [Dicrocoelium dendriticum]|nr:unnamed protein product [Dicrocoelium dendriticum]